MDSNPLLNRGRSLEEEYFRKLERERVELLREQWKQDPDPIQLCRALDTDQTPLVERLVAHGIGPEHVPAFHALPLVEVAWADGSIDEQERWRVLEAATRFGVEFGRPAHQLLETWLASPPASELYDLWHKLALHSRPVGRVLQSAEGVAAAAGGLFGFATISRSERQVLTRIRRSLAGVTERAS